MFRPMRRIKQQLSQEECTSILRNEVRGVLSVLGDEGYPLQTDNNINLYYVLIYKELDLSFQIKLLCFSIHLEESMFVVLDNKKMDLFCTGIDKKMRTFLRNF